MSKIVLLMGAPGAGKGTQARLLQERLNLPQISTGDIFRALRDARTPLAEEVRAMMEAGHLVSDDLTVRVVRERTGRDDCKHGYILDGFPRTPAQATMLEKLAVEQQKRIQAILLDVPRELLEEWKAKDPILKAEKMLRELGHADDAVFKEVGERVKKEVEAGLEFAERSPLPEGPETLEGVFAIDNEV